MKKILLSLTMLLAFAPAFGFANPTKYLSGDADMLVHFDFQRLQKSQTFKDILGMVSNTPNFKKGMQEVKDKFGIDVMRDVQAVSLQLIAPQTPKGQATVFGYLSVKGLNSAKVLSAMKTEGADVKTEKIGARTVYIASPDGKQGFEFVNGGVVFGDLAQVRAAKAAAMSGRLSELAKQLDPTKQDLWAGVLVSPTMAAAAMKTNPMLAQFTKMVGSLDLSSGLHLNLRATGKNAKDIKKLADMAQGQIQNMAKSPQAAMFGGMISKVKAEAQGDTFVVDIPLSQTDVNQIKMMVGMMMMGLKNKASTKTKSAPK